MEHTGVANRVFDAVPCITPAAQCRRHTERYQRPRLTGLAGA